MPYRIVGRGKAIPVTFLGGVSRKHFGTPVLIQGDILREILETVSDSYVVNLFVFVVLKKRTG